uniref:heparan sulfate glucosamine 3-O-sulfotransferase 1-like n=1 Tax=Styela clava TaxID=7725 RepID=UPI001939D997|nr:heparan sulfate glucosamine 3-O-sulfotransferase 1-like [Styela clava]
MRYRLGICVAILPIIICGVIYHKKKGSVLPEVVRQATQQLTNMIKYASVENSVFSDRKLLNNWPKWTKKMMMQPWMDSENKNSTDEIKGEQKRLPTVIGIGVRKCGTTAFHNFMRIHPQFKPAEGEVHFFDSDFYDEGKEAYSFKIRFADVVFSSIYLCALCVPSRIMICYQSQNNYHSLRSGITSVLGLLFPKTAERPYRRKWVSKFKSFDSHINSAINDILKIQENPLKTLGYGTFESFVRNSWNERTFQLTILTHGMYYYHLKTWFNFFPPSQIHIVDGENLIKNPVYELKKVEQFLGISDVINDKLFRYDSTKGFYCLTEGECLGKHKGVSRQAGGPEMSEEDKHKLSLFFKPFNQRLFELLDNKFDWT